MESHRLRFDAEGRPIEFSTWQRQATRYLTSQRQDGATLWAHASGALKAPLSPDPLPTDLEPTLAEQEDYDRRVLARDVWDSRDAATALALTELLPQTEAVHFAQVETAQGIWDAVVARNSTPSSASLSRFLMPFMFPDLGSFATVSNLVTHLRSLDVGFRAACTNAQLLVAPPPLPPRLFVECAAPQLPTFTATRASVAVSVSEDTAAVSAADWQKRDKSGKKGGKGGGRGGGGGGGAGSGGGGGGGGGDAPRGGSLRGVAGHTGPPTGGVPIDGGVGPQQQPQQQQPQQRQQQQQAPQQGVTVTFVGGGRTAVCTDAVTGRVLATFTREPRSGFYVLHTEHSPISTSAQVAASPQGVASPPAVASGMVAVSCSCRSFTHRTVLWHHRLGHPSIPRLRTMASHRLVPGLPSIFPSLPPLPATPCTPCVAGCLRATPHSSLCPPTAPFQTLHLDVWGPAPTQGP
ncbi:unnamed protein product [Closterium sp. NIES-53]